jgi:hypothetical protein
MEHLSMIRTAAFNRFFGIAILGDETGLGNVGVPPPTPRKGNG